MSRVKPIIEGLDALKDKVDDFLDRVDDVYDPETDSYNISALLKPKEETPLDISQMSTKQRNAKLRELEEAGDEEGLAAFKQQILDSGVKISSGVPNIPYTAAKDRIGPSRPRGRPKKIKDIEQEVEGVTTADTLEPSTLDEAVESVYRKNTRADALREVRQKRFETMQDQTAEEAIDAVNNFNSWDKATPKGLAALQERTGFTDLDSYLKSEQVGRPKITETKTVPFGVDGGTAEVNIVNPNLPAPTPPPSKKFKLEPLEPSMITVSKGKFDIPIYDSSGNLQPYYKIQRLIDNELQLKKYGLVSNRHTDRGMAEFMVVSHSARGMATANPDFIAELAGDKGPVLREQAFAFLQKARDDYTDGMEELVKMKRELVENPATKQKLVEIAKRLGQYDEKLINNYLLDMAHIFPFTETNKIRPNSMYLTQGGNPAYIYVSPTYINKKIQTLIDKKIAGNQMKIRDQNISATDPRMKEFAEEEEYYSQLLRKLKALSVIPADKYGVDNVVLGMTELNPGMSGKPYRLTKDDYGELFELLLTEGRQLKFDGQQFNEGGLAVTVPLPATEEVDEDTGMLDFLSDARDSVMEKVEDADAALDNFVEERLDGNPYRAVPVAISTALKAPGDLADFIIDQREELNNDLEERAMSAEEAGDTKLAQRLRRQKVGVIGTYANPIVLGGKIFDFLSYPLQEGYERMFTDEDYIYIPGYGKIQADTGMKKALAAGVTLGLTGLEVFSLVKPQYFQLFKQLSPNRIARYLQHGANFLSQAAPFIAGYETKDPMIFGENGLIEYFKGNQEAKDETEKVIQEDTQDPATDVYVPMADGGLMGEDMPLEFLENKNYAQTRLSRGGDPGQFTNPTSLALEEDFDARDILNEPGYESIEELDDLFDITKKENRFIPRDDLAVQVAGGRGEGVKYILNNVPEWVRQGKERIKMGVQNILPGTREQPPGLPTVIDDTADGLTPLTKQEPGQIFYQQMEAELLQGPKVFKDKQAFFDYMQARNIGKVEVLDSEIERVIDSLTQKNMPITRETLIGVLRESPVRFVQSKGYGFLSDTLDGKQRGLKYSGYKEAGEIPNTSRERVLFVDPKDLRGDPGSVPGSVSQHNWEEPYTIAWSRLSDRDLGGAYAGKTVTFADEIQSDIFQGSQKMAGKLAAKIKYMADNNVPLDKIDDDIQREILAYFGDRKHVFRESLPSAAALKQEYDQLMSLQDQLRELANTPVPEMTDAMIEAAKKVQFQQADVLDNLTQRLNLDLNRYLFPNLPFKLRGQWADASIKRDIYEAAYRKFVLKDPNATDYYAVTPANLVTRRYSHEGTTATPAADRAADKERRIQSWVSGGMDGDIASSRYPGVGMYEFYGGPGADVVTESGKHYTSEIEKILKRIARENNVPLEVLPVRTGDRSAEVFNVVDRNTGEILGSGNTGRQADAIANDIIANSDRKVVVQRAEGFDTTDSFGIELTPSMAEAFKAYMAKGGYVNEEILLPYGD